MKGVPVFWDKMNFAMCWKQNCHEWWTNYDSEILAWHFEDLQMGDKMRKCITRIAKSFGYCLMGNQITVHLKNSVQMVRIQLPSKGRLVPDFALLNY